MSLHETARKDRKGVSRQVLPWLLGLLLAMMAARTHADDDWLARAFGTPPPVSVLWLTPDLRAALAAQAGFVPAGARLRYWRDGERTAWQLEHIGKEAPITFGVVVEAGAIRSLDVLVYRESRGHEIRAAHWRARFAGLRADGTTLDRPVDNITGATLSVRAATRVARLALALHEAVTDGAH